MAEKADEQGRVQVVVRMFPEEVRALDALKLIQDRDSRGSMGRVAIKDYLARMKADPEIGPQLKEILEGTRV